MATKELPFNLTTTQLVKRLLPGSDTDPDIDAVVGNFIPVVSEMIQDWIDRPVKSLSRTLLLNREAGQQEFVLPAYPVSSITSIKVSKTRDWSNTEAMETDKFLLEDDGEFGVLIIDTPLSVVGEGVIQVIYVGGIASDFADIQTKAPAIVSAASHQCAEVVRRRDDPARSRFEQAGGGTMSKDALELLPIVKRMLRSYQNHQMD